MNRELNSIFLKESRRRKFRYTKTKATIGFLLSLAFSIVFTPFFERYGSLMVQRFGSGIYFLFTGEPDLGVTAASASPAPAVSDNQHNLRARIARLRETSQVLNANLTAKRENALD
jgi:hypothetical protein